MTHTLKHIYKKFNSEYPEYKISYFEFKNIVYDSLNTFMDCILMEGGKLELNNSLSYMQIIKYKRSFFRKTINWPETKKLRKQGIQDRLVYHTTPFYFKMYWNKDRAKLRNKSVYRLRLLRGTKGTTRKLLSLEKDTMVHPKFPLISNR